MKRFKIGAAIMVHNMQDLIPSSVSSINWVDAVYLFDDHCSDKSVELAKRFCKTELFIERSPFKEPAFTNGELETRNYIIKKAFELMNADILILLDADEILSDILKPVIISAFSNKNIDSIALSVWHLFDEKRYIHIWETCINGVYMIDPHVRVIRKGLLFQPRFSNGSHPGIKITPKTLCIHGAYHFHLRYLFRLKLPNYSLYFLPTHPSKEDYKPYLKRLDFTSPKDINECLKLLRWKRNLETDLNHYEELRIKLTKPGDALIHPRDVKIKDET